MSKDRGKKKVSPNKSQRSSSESSQEKIPCQTRLIENIELPEKIDESCKVSEPDRRDISPQVARRRTRRRGHASRGRGGNHNRGRGGRPVSPKPEPEEEKPAIEKPTALSETEQQLRLKGDTVIHEVVLDNNFTLLQDLIRKGYRIFNQSTFDGAQPLHRAAEIDSLECARILIEQNADVDALDFSGRTSYHVASIFGNCEVARFLLRNGARKLCRPGCAKCRNMSQILQKQKVAAEKAERLRKEKEDKEAKEAAQETDFYEELRKHREELGGPYFTKQENREYRKQVKKAREEFREVIKPKQEKKPRRKPDLEKYEEQKQLPLPETDSPPLTPDIKHKFSSESPPDEEVAPQDIIQPIRARRRAKITQELGVDVEEQYYNEVILDYYEQQKKEENKDIIKKRK